MKINPLTAPAGSRLALMGNEAIARGVLEAGIYVVTGYPGTPSSEVIMTLQEYGKGLDIYVEWAVNERVALEVALGASMGGARSMVTMKAPGLNVASDPLISAAYSGVNGGMVVLVADDPGPHTTQTEQDNRWFAKLAKLPMLSPSSPQEAKDYVKISVEISEETSLPVLIRTTTRVNHTVGEVVLGELHPPVKYRFFKRDPERFVRAGMVWNLARHTWLEETLSKVEEIIAKHTVNRVLGNGEICVVCEGVSCNYVLEASEELGVKDALKIIQLGLVHPLPEAFITKQLKGCSKVLVVEELDPFLETGIESITARHGLRVELYGKRSKHIPLVGELSPIIVKKALGRIVGREVEGAGEGVSANVPQRPPPLCPGCPHRFSFVALREALRRAGFNPAEIPIIGDIGCYALGVYPPLNSVWVEHSMGASISIAMGLKVAGLEKPVVAVIGDSTLYHSGITSLIEAVHKNVDLLVLVLDNEVVAMTGHQSTPAWGETETGRKTRRIDIVDLIRGAGVEELLVVDPYDLDETISAVSKLLGKRGVKVLVARHPCALIERRKRPPVVKLAVDPEKCTSCRACVAATGCPSLMMVDGKVVIDEDECNGCLLCSRYCPVGAIVVKENGVK